MKVIYLTTMLSRRNKKSRYKTDFFDNKNVKINASRIVAFYALYVNQLSYVQRDERHE